MYLDKVKEVLEVNTYEECNHYLSNNWKLLKIKIFNVEKAFEENGNVKHFSVIYKFYILGKE